MSRYLVDARWYAPHGLGRFAKEVIDRLPGAECLTNGPSLLSPTDPIWLSYQIFRKRPQAYFSPGFNPPLISKVPFVFTIGDLIHLRVSEEGSRGKDFYYYFLVRPAIERSHAVVTFSEYSKKEIVEWSGADPAKVKVVGCGVGPEFGPQGEKHQPGYPYLLYIGNRKPHKNVNRLLEAFANSAVPEEIHMVLSGKETAETMEHASRLGIANRVVFAGIIPDSKLPAYYRGAVALTFPSLYEGFGLPPLEAMACGTPVITSNVTSLPEVVSDAAISVDPKNTEAIGCAIKQVVGDSSLRQALTRQGLQQAQKFSWDHTGMLVRQILESALAR